MVSDFDRGKKEGVTEALLAEHTARLDAMNGNIARFAAANETLSKWTRDGFTKLESAVREIQEDMRSAALALKVTADTLATETERRREELAVTATATESSAQHADRAFSKREKVLSLIVAVVVPAAGIYFGLSN